MSYRYFQDAKCLPARIGRFPAGRNDGIGSVAMFALNARPQLVILVICNIL